MNLQEHNLRHVHTHLQTAHDHLHTLLEAHRLGHIETIPKEHLAKIHLAHNHLAKALGAADYPSGADFKNAPRAR